MLFIYTKWKGAGYLRDTLQNVLDRLIATSQDMTLELDPERVSSQEELAANVNNLQVVSRVFINSICHSVHKMPPVFRKICSIVSLRIAFTLNGHTKRQQADRMYRSRKRPQKNSPTPSTQQSARSSSCASSARRLYHR